MCPALPTAAAPRRRPDHRRFWSALSRTWGLTCLLAPLLLTTSTALSAADRDADWTLKFTFVYRLIQETAWPTNALGDPGSQFAVGVIGSPKVVAEATSVLADETAHDRDLVVRPVAEGEDPSAVQVLFLTGLERRRQRQLLESLGDRPVLTIGDADGFCQDGGMINLRATQGRTRLEVNPVALKRVNLRLGSQVLKLATLVPEKGN